LNALEKDMKGTAICDETIEQRTRD